MLEKACIHCEEVKSLDQFHRHAQMADGHINSALGLLADDPDIIRAAADYVEFHASVREEHMNVPTNNDSIGTN